MGVFAYDGLGQPARRAEQLRGLGDGLRLELVLELLADVAGADAVLRPFEGLAGLGPNFNHLALASLGAESALVTSNQDLLLERAAELLHLAVEVEHLHGRCDDPASIVALIRQYMRGLPGPVVDHLIELIDGRPLVVIGYSGRDPDIMGALLQSRPRHVTWVSRSGPHDTPGTAQLQRQSRGRWAERHEGARAWLAREVGNSAAEAFDRAVATLPPGGFSWSAEARADIQRLPRAVRALALSRLAERRGQMRLATDLVDRSRTRDPRRRVELAMARARLRMEAGQTREPLARYGRIARDPLAGSAAHASAVQGQVEIYSNSSRHDEAFRLLDALDAELAAAGEPAEIMSRRAWAANARANMHRMHGELREAEKVYAAGLEAARKGDALDSVIEIQTWQADTAFQRGNYARGFALLESASSDAREYARTYTLGWPAFVEAEGRTLCGQYDDAVHALERARTAFELAGHRQGLAWVAIQHVSAGKHLGDPTFLIQIARESIQIAERRQRLAYAEARLLLEEAECARADERHEDVDRRLTELRAILNATPLRSEHGPPAVMAACATLLAGEWLRQQGAAGADEVLREATRMFKAIGARSFHLRARIALWHLSENVDDADRLLAACRRGGFRVEERFLVAKSPYFPLDFI